MSKRKKILIILIVLAIIVLSFIGGNTYSKYLTELSNHVTGDVATWNFELNGKTSDIEPIDLASTCTEATVLDNKIAPGTKGRFSIFLDATGSDVGVNYKVEFKNKENLPKNLKFECRHTNWTTLEELQEHLHGTINANASVKYHTIVIDWEWPYETGSGELEKAENDKIDTEDAKNIKNFNFDIVVTGTQVKPEEQQS